MNKEEEKKEMDTAEIRLERIPVEVKMTDIELDELKSQLQEYKDKYFRLLAEMENARKRIQKENLESTQYAIQNVINEFIHPIDHFERALNISQQMSDEVKNWGIGFQMILTQFKDALSSYGVTEIDAKPGDVFDPHIHEAIDSIETTKYPPGTIVEETMRGYRMKGKTIRPARVTVAKAKEPKPEENQ